LVDSYQIKGEIIAEEGKPIKNATIYVRIEDTSRADAPSKIVAEIVLKNGKLISNLEKSVIPFNISIPVARENKMYTVSVHIDMNGNGKLDKGDYINMESYSVPALGVKKKVVVKVKQIK
jgi:uncharacterized lipoprotein YbaY